MRRIGSTHYHPGVTAHAAVDRMVAAWDCIRERFGAYSLVLPGTPSFICQPNLCTAHCCHAFSVNMGEAEASRMARETGMALVQFLELEEGDPITLPLAQPFLLAREGGHCRFLGPELGCTIYAGRPNACRLYPHFVIFLDTATGKVTTPPLEDGRRAVDALLAGQSSSPVPLLLGHVECPGFIGDPLPEASWRTLLEATYQLQYEEL